MDKEKLKLMNEVLTNRYLIGYLAMPKNRDMAIKLNELGYYNDETGQATEVAQNYFDYFYNDVKDELIKEIRRLLINNPKRVTYNQLSNKLGMLENTFILHHFLTKLNREKEIIYREIDNFNSVLMIK